MRERPSLREDVIIGVVLTPFGGILAIIGGELLKRVTQLRDPFGIALVIAIIITVPFRGLAIDLWRTQRKTILALSISAWITIGVTLLLRP